MMYVRPSLLCVLLFGLLANAGAARADEFRLAYFELSQVGVDTYDALLRVPARGEAMRLAVHMRMPAGAVIVETPRDAFVADSHVQRWRVRQTGGLEGQTIAVDGLADSSIEMLVRFQPADGAEQVIRLTRDQSSFTLAVSPLKRQVAATYLLLGVEHILAGFDHLLFVLALLVLIRGAKRIVLTVTSFTVAHTITLAAATLGFVSVRGPPVEATIALSIVFLAREIALVWQGKASLTAQFPWLVAFVFGLLHGLGFAGALAEIGLPENSIPLALLSFNAGVELGQLMFVGAVLLIAKGASRWLTPKFHTMRWFAPYGIGAVASYWLISRVALFAN